MQSDTRLYGVFIILFFLNVKFCYSDYALLPDVPTTVKLAPNSQSKLVVNQLYSVNGYAVIQAHTQYRNITLSLNPAEEQRSENFETGTNVGLVVIFNGQATYKVFLISRHNVTVNVLVSFILYNDIFYPVPGGCNIEFNMANDPNLKMSYGTYMSHVEFQFARGSVNDRRCERSPALNKMSYHLYVYYIGSADLSEKTYFNSMKKIMNYSGIMEHATRVKEFKYSSSMKPLLSLPSYPGQGAVYSLIVKYDGAVSAYVPIATYSCDLYDDIQSSCRYSNTITKVLIAVAGVVGLFLCFFGHRFFQTGNWLMSFCGFCAVFYVVLHFGQSMSLTVLFVLACILAAVAGALWLMVWWCIGQPVVSVLVPGLTAGYVIASILFFTPLGNLHYWSTRYNYGMSFSVAVLLIPVLLLYWTKTLNILSCAFIGSFLVTMTMDVWLDSGLKYIMINTFRHVYVDQYLNVIVTGPYQTKDIILTCFWCILFIIGVAIQFYTVRGRPEFPPCPRKIRRRRLHQEREEGHIPPRYTNRTSTQNESAPLLSNVLDHNYATIQDNQDVT